MSKKSLCVVFDIDETLIHFIPKQYRHLWDDLSQQEKKIFNDNCIVLDTKKEVIIFRPHIQELFNYFKSEPLIKVAIWTYSEREYAEYIAGLLIKKLKLPKDFFMFKWGEEDTRDLDYSKDLNKVYEEFANYNKFNTFLVDDLHGNVRHTSNKENSVLIHPFAPFGTKKARERPQEQAIGDAKDDKCFLELIDIAKKVLDDIKNCTNEEIEEAFREETVFSKKRIQRLGISNLLKTYATGFTSLITLGNPHQDAKFIKINNYSSFLTGGERIHNKSKKAKRRNNKTKKQRNQ
jgi:hypothetical protein